MESTGTGTPLSSLIALTFALYTKLAAVMEMTPEASLLVCQTLI